MIQFKIPTKYHKFLTYFISQVNIMFKESYIQIKDMTPEHYYFLDWESISTYIESFLLGPPKPNQCLLLFYFML
jgi:hypothetical protein